MLRSLTKIVHRRHGNTNNVTLVGFREICPIVSCIFKEELSRLTLRPFNPKKIQLTRLVGDRGREQFRHCRALFAFNIAFEVGKNIRVGFKRKYFSSRANAA